MPDTVDKGRVWISIITAIGAFVVSGLSIYFGYKLFLNGAIGGFTISSSSSNGVGVYFASACPGLGFALFGMFIAFQALNRLIRKD